MKRQFTAGAAAKRKLRVFRLRNKFLIDANISLLGDLKALQDHNIDLKVAKMRLENQLKQAEEKHALAVEDANFHKQLNNIATEDEKSLKKTLLEQHKIIQQQGKEIFQLDNDLYDMKRRRDGLVSILTALIISVIILLVW
jgi:hypothetical protein